MIPDPTEQPTLDVEEAGRLLGLGKTKAYEEANRWLRTNGAEGLPCLKFGRTLRVPTAQLRRLLSMDEPLRDEAPLAGGAPVLSLAEPRSSRGVRRG
ncbi:MAG: helix-turn-helix domain-containing protein [Actinomycetota bacterium]|nr:helix-turn-helix domain-containing protein [Actinomycetota bacterium]